MPGSSDANASSRPRRGRAPARSRHEIAEAAISLADRDGLAAVTMRAIAQALGTGAASLYRYISTRDELLALMVDEVNGEFSLRAPGQRPWPDQMLDLAHEARDIYRRHPWMIEALDTTPVLGPNGYAYLDLSLAVLAPTRADGRTMLEAVGVFNGLVRMLCKQERDQLPTDEADSAPQAALADPLAVFPPSDAPYPHIAAAMADAGTSADQFDRILRRVIIGLLPDGH